MKHLILMRHAKSSWADPETADADRPLNARGRISAAAMGAWLAEQGVRPDHVILSPARRSGETWERLRQFVGNAEPQTVNEVYMASPDQLLAVLQSTPGKAETVLLIGHQPGIGALVRKLADGSVPSDASRAFREFPTSATAILAVDIKDWAKLKFGKAEFRKFALPKDVV